MHPPRRKKQEAKTRKQFLPEILLIPMNQKNRNLTVSKILRLREYIPLSEDLL